VFSRVLIANRGEVAVRVIRTLHELGIEAVAVYSTADRDSMHVRLADRAVCIGPPAPAESYLKIPSIVAAAPTTRCEAVHPGWGFLAESPAFAEACADNELVFIGPRPETMARMGNKVIAKEELRAAGVPVVPGSNGTTTLAEARESAAEVGYPVLLKAVAGGGGRGMRVVESRDELEPAFQLAAAESEAAFGDSRLYLEQVVQPARHVEVQVLADGSDGVLTLGERECSIQRRHQKLIEESPSPALSPEGREAMEDAAERAARVVGYRNAGTFEFLVAPGGSFYFMELNARLQVEHPVTELVAGVDIVREQLRIAAGEPLAQTGRAERRGHAIEVRINAEDPARDFMPSPGRIERFSPPLGPGVRVDTCAESGCVVSPFYDSLLGKLVVWDVDRPGAIARCLRALGELQLEGVPTTAPAAADILRSEEFQSGRYSTSYLTEAAGRLPALSESV
jgi:acetyl-CoA carboxylase biotin carboxylase subunit